MVCKRNADFAYAKGFGTEGPSQIDKVRDHDHLTGKDRRAAHCECNINVKQKQSSFVPILFPNFFGYDCQLISDILLTQDFKMGYESKTIPESMENYVNV